jgi:hypothetical protein
LSRSRWCGPCLAQPSWWPLPKFCDVTSRLARSGIAIFPRIDRRRRWTLGGACWGGILALSWLFSERCTSRVPCSAYGVCAVHPSGLQRDGEDSVSGCLLGRRRLAHFRPKLVAPAVRYTSANPPQLRASATETNQLLVKIETRPASQLSQLVVASHFQRRCMSRPHPHRLSPVPLFDG